MDDEHATEQRAVNVRLAVNLARHSANGWDDAALPDDYTDIAQFLRVDVERAKAICGVPNETLY
jgi:ferritin-like protein